MSLRRLRRVRRLHYLPSLPLASDVAAMLAAVPASEPLSPTIDQSPPPMITKRSKTATAKAAGKAKPPFFFRFEVRNGQILVL
jgi:hypothetical protein